LPKLLAVSLRVLSRRGCRPIGSAPYGRAAAMGKPRVPKQRPASSTVGLIIRAPASALNSSGKNVVANTTNTIAASPRPNTVLRPIPNGMAVTESKRNRPCAQEAAKDGHRCSGHTILGLVALLEAACILGRVRILVVGSKKPMEMGYLEDSLRLLASLICAPRACLRHQAAPPERS
jgi:hypothetical protein